MKPEIIIFMEGGLIQSTASNVAITIYNLDDDVVESYDFEPDEYLFNNRTSLVDDLITNEKEWKEFKRSEAKAWNRRIKNAGI